MVEPFIDSLHDVYEEQLGAARYKAERDAAMQELKAMRERNIELWMESGMANELVTCAEQKAERLGKLVWRLQNRLARAHRRERSLRKGMREWREKVIGAPVRTMSAYDLLPEEDLQALRWVREHGGIEVLRRMFQDADSRRVELCAALGIDLDTGWSDAMAELDRRLMPEGMEWPRYESGEPVRPSDKLLDKDGDWFKAVSFVFTCDWWSVRGYQTEGFGDLNDKTRRTLEGMSYGTCVKRPAPKVLDADGAEIRVGDTVYHVKDGSEMTVYGIDGEWLVVSVGGRVRHDVVTHRAPVIAADGRPLREGETVYLTDSPTAFVVDDIMTREDGATVVHLKDGAWHLPQDLTHERPDSWERLEEDAKLGRCDYNKAHGYPACCIDCDGLPLSDSCSGIMARDLVRRAKKLAERGE